MNLPKVFQNKNIGNVNNDQEYFYSLSKNERKKEDTPKINIDDKINSLFKSNKFIYKINVTVRLENREYDTIIVGKVNNNLITIDNDLIPIKDILDIKEK